MTNDFFYQLRSGFEQSPDHDLIRVTDLVSDDDNYAKIYIYIYIYIYNERRKKQINDGNIFFFFRNLLIPTLVIIRKCLFHVCFHFETERE